MDKEKETLEDEKNLNEAQENEKQAYDEDVEDMEQSQESDLQAKLEQAENTAKDYLDRLQRAMAEFDNFRKRTNVEKASMYENGSRDIIEKLLPVYDNFERAITSTPEEDKASNVFKGLEMIYKQFSDLFISLNIEELPGVGEAF